MTSRPVIDRLSIWDCNELEIKRDPENNCLEIVCRGEDKYARLNIIVWSSEDGKAPVAKIDKTLVDVPPAPDLSAMEALIHAVEDNGSEG